MDNLSDGTKKVQVELHVDQLLTTWINWSKTADRTENGWQSDFPQWRLLMDKLKEEMTAQPTAESVKRIAKGWSISEEDEDLSEFAKADLGVPLSLLVALSSDDDPEVRWQAYDTIGHVCASLINLLFGGAKDQDKYTRKRSQLRVQEIRQLLATPSRVD